MRHAGYELSRETVMTAHKVGIIVPVYNVAPFLKTCLDSILNQTMQDFLCYIVDDGSTDGSEIICDEYQKRDNRVIVVHQKNKGVSAARNAALDKVRKDNLAEFITFIDSDDLVAPTYLEELLNGILNGAQISAVSFLRFSNDYHFPEETHKATWDIKSPHDYYLKHAETRSQLWGKLYPAHYLNDVRFPEDEINEDELTSYKVIFKANQIASTSSPLYAYRFRVGSIMNSPWSTKRLARLEAYRNQIYFFNDLGHDDLVNDLRSWLIIDLTDAVRNLKKIGERRKAEELRRELASELKIGNFPFTENYLAYKTAHPIFSRVLKVFSSIRILHHD
jgi:glycosyltransferase involved in cell wall biosynthesis